MPVLPRHLGVESRLLLKTLAIKQSGFERVDRSKTLLSSLAVSNENFSVHNLISKREGGIRYSGGGVLPCKRLMGMNGWMGSHFHDWIEYNGVAFTIEND